MVDNGDEAASSASLTDTALRIRAASSGDAAQMEWLVSHLHPLLVRYATYRLPSSMRQLFDPEDIAQRTWGVVFANLGKLEPRDGRLTPVLIKFMSVVMLRMIRDLMEKHLVGKPMFLSTSGSSDDSVGIEIAESTAGASTRAMRSETIKRVRSTLNGMNEEEREILVLRGLEQLSYEQIVTRIGSNVSTLRVRYMRALDRLRGCLPRDLVDDLSDHV